MTTSGTSPSTRRRIRLRRCRRPCVPRCARQRWERSTSSRGRRWRIPRRRVGSGLSTARVDRREPFFLHRWRVCFSWSGESWASLYLYSS